jgi:4-amino-4-deoxy-L-arabinose transferase-like glycosyltransferase
LAVLDGTPLAVLLLTVVVVRLVADFAVDAGGVDRYEFGIIADRVLAGQGFSYFGVVDGRPTVEFGAPGSPLPSAFMPPLYTAVVILASGVASLLNGDPVTIVWLVRVANLALAVLTAVAIHWLTRNLANRRAAHLAVLVFAVYPTVVYQATQVSAANAYLTVEMFLLAGLAGSALAATPRTVAAAAGWVGILCLLRSEAVLLLAILPFWIWHHGMPAGAGRRTRLRLMALFLAVAVVLPGAWMVRSSLALGTPISTVTTTGGFNLWVGNHAGASGSQKDVTTPPELERRIGEVPPSSAYEVDRDAIYFSAAVSSMIEDPGGTALRDLKKLGLMLGVDVHDSRSDHPAYIAGYALLLILGIPGAISWWRTRNDEPRLRWAHATMVAGYVVLTLAVPVVFFALARFRVPWEIVLIIATAILLAGPTSRPPAEVASGTRGRGPAPS